MGVKAFPLNFPRNSFSCLNGSGNVLLSTLKNGDCFNVSNQEPSFDVVEGEFELR